VFLEFACRSARHIVPLHRIASYAPGNFAVAAIARASTGEFNDYEDFSESAGRSGSITQFRY
jgi:hypothetical protein